MHIGTHRYREKGRTPSRCTHYLSLTRLQLNCSQIRLEHYRSINRTNIDWPVWLILPGGGYMRQTTNMGAFRVNANKKREHLLNSSYCFLSFPSFWTGLEKISPQANCLSNKPVILIVVQVIVYAKRGKLNIFSCGTLNEVK